MDPVDPVTHLGLVGYDSFHFATLDLERSRRFYADKFGFHEIARSGEELSSQSGQRSVVFSAGGVRVCLSTPTSPNSKAARYLRHHPAGVMSLSLRVADLDRAISYLEARGATFLNDPVEDNAGTASPDASGGRYRAVEIATALGDVALRFVERSGHPAFAPGFVGLGVELDPPVPNEFGISAIDHVTANGLTMQPTLAFYRDVLGFVPFWEVAFHTGDVAPHDERAAARELSTGSGLKSAVMWDPPSGVKFATNEPLRPRFRESQVYRFVDDNGGPGVQHIAFAVDDIISTVAQLRRRGVAFMPTPPEYYRDLPRRLAALGIHNVKEELSILEQHQILLDGSHDRYMLQIFVQDARALYSDERAGPFFYEIIQRCGDEGFGYGNFRALFESVERAQQGEACAGGTAPARGTGSTT